MPTPYFDTSGLHTAHTNSISTLGYPSAKVSTSRARAVRSTQPAVYPSNPTFPTPRDVYFHHSSLLSSISLFHLPATDNKRQRHHNSSHEEALLSVIVVVCPLLLLLVVSRSEPPARAAPGHRAWAMVVHFFLVAGRVVAAVRRGYGLHGVLVAHGDCRHGIVGLFVIFGGGGHQGLGMTTVTVAVAFAVSTAAAAAAAAVGFILVVAVVTGMVVVVVTARLAAAACLALARGV